MPEFFSGGSGLYSTLNDYQKFLRALLNGGAGSCRRKPWRRCSATRSAGCVRAILPSADPALNAGADTTPGVTCGWGLGFMLYPEDKPGGRHAGSGSWAGLANTHFWVDPSAGLAGVILMQILPFCDEKAMEAYRGFETGRICCNAVARYNATCNFPGTEHGYYRRNVTKTKITALPGDGIGPEVMQATMQILEAANAPVEWEMAEAGAEAFKKGLVTGVPRETLDSIARNGLALKSPLETPVGYGGKSANVTLRKYFELYANIRPVRELPGVTTPFTGRGIDMVIVRENVEDVYAGIEHMQTTTVAQCLKLMTAPGCERIIRAAFGLAEAEERKKVTTATKANIMKLTEGMMKRVAEKVGAGIPGH